MTTQAPGTARDETDQPLGAAFWTVWSASTAVNLGDGVRLVALPLLATRLTSDPALIALVTVVTFLPAVVFGSLAGVLVDRVDRRQAMLAANSGRALILLTLVALIANDLMTMPWLLLFALLYGIGEVIADPAAHAYLPRIVAPQQLGRANSKIFTGQIVGEDFVGRALGGVLFAGAAFLPFAGNAAVLVLAALLIATVPPDPSTPPVGPETGGTPAQRVWTDLREGLRFVFSSPPAARDVAAAGRLGCHRRRVLGRGRGLCDHRAESQRQRLRCLPCRVSGRIADRGVPGHPATRTVGCVPHRPGQPRL